MQESKKYIKILLGVVFLLWALTHRHEDYCTKHPHRMTGEAGQAKAFGPWHHAVPQRKDTMDLNTGSDSSTLLPNGTLFNKEVE